MDSLGVGIHKISLERYLCDPCEVPSLSRGTIKTLVSDVPARAYFEHPRLGGSREQCFNPALDMGQLCHSLLLEGIDKAQLINPEDYPAKNGNTPKGWTNPAIREAGEKARLAGQIPMLPDDYNRAIRIVQSAQEYLAKSELKISSLQSEGESELTYIWEEIDGVYCRVRPDWISADRTIILDCKFTGLQVSPEAFDRQIGSFGYGIQHAFYRRGVDALESSEPTFIFLVVETSPPFIACLMGLSPQYAVIGEQQVDMGIDIWKHCMSEGHWPGYDNRVHYLEPKAWAITQWEERRFSKQLSEQGDDPTADWGA